MLTGTLIMARKSDPDYWQQVLSNQNSSGLTQSQWCEQHKINIHNFRYCKRRLSSQPKVADDLTQTKWALVTESKLDTPDDVDTSLLRIHVGKAIIEVNGGFDPKILSDVILVLMKHI